MVGFLPPSHIRPGPESDLPRKAEAALLPLPLQAYDSAARLV